jgi:hypothetical protein
VAGGRGLATGQINNGGTHAGGTGLNGFAGLARLLPMAGYDVALARGKGDLTTPGVLVLTPSPYVHGEVLDKIVAHHRRIGPVVVIAPKWDASTLPDDHPQAKKAGCGCGVRLCPSGRAFSTMWAWISGKRAKARAGWPQPCLPLRRSCPMATGWRWAAAPPDPIGRCAGQVLAARYDETITLPGDVRGDDRQRYPLYLVFEPDLLDNYGLSHADNALWAEAFFRQVAGNGPRRITFDLTLNGLGRQPNLLTLAFMPPYLTATLVLGLAVLAAVWRGWCGSDPWRRRIAPSRWARHRCWAMRGLWCAGRGGSICWRALCRGGAGAAGPCAVPAARQGGADAAIDRALAARRALDPSLPDHTFTAIAARLSRARTEREVLDLARTLHDIERTLIP